MLALLGPNGAGKTTALSLLLGLRRPDSGRAELFGRDPTDPAARAGDRRHAAGARLPADASRPRDPRPRPCALPRPAARSDLLERFGLAEIARRQAGGLSGGERRRLAVALAFAADPRAVFLDEPTTGLDVEARLAVWDEVRAYAATGGTVLLTTHHLEEAERLASRIVLLAGGRVVADGTAPELSARASAAGLEDAFLTLTREAGVRLVLVHARASTLELLRYPAFSVPTIAFPALFFLFFVAPRSDADPTLLLASFAGFAVLAVAFFQFGVGIAAEREAPWERFVRTLPLRARTRFAARVLSASLFGLASAALVVGRSARDDRRPPHGSALGRARGRAPAREPARSRSSGSRSATGPRRAARCRSRTSSISCWRSPAGSGPPPAHLPDAVASVSPLAADPPVRQRAVGRGRRAISGGRATGSLLAGLGRRASAWSRPGATAETRGGDMAEIA